jgi:peptidase E
MPNVDQIDGLLLDQDVVWVFGGSVAGLLAMWRLHGVDAAMRRVWEAGVGSICWHAGGTTDSFGPELRPVTNGLALVPFANGVHYDSEPQRRPLFRQLIAEATLPSGYATDDGAGLLYRGTEFVEIVCEAHGAAGYFVDKVEQMDWTRGGSNRGRLRASARDPRSTITALDYAAPLRLGARSRGIA